MDVEEYKEALRTLHNENWERSSVDYYWHGYVTAIDRALILASKIMIEPSKPVISRIMAYWIEKANSNCGDDEPIQVAAWIWNNIDRVFWQRWIKNYC